MIIKLSPIRCDKVLEVYKSGDVLTVNGVDYDFSFMVDYDTLQADAIQSEWFLGEVTKEDGELTLTLMLPIPANYSQEQAFPVDLVNVPDGLVAFPQPLSNVEN
jgi:hypothetical protein